MIELFVLALAAGAMLYMVHLGRKLANADSTQEAVKQMQRAKEAAEREAEIYSKPARSMPAILDKLREHANDK